MLPYQTGWTIPDEERGAANKLSQNLVLLSQHLDHFETAIALFDDAVAAQAAMESDFRAAFPQPQGNLLSFSCSPRAMGR
jgi:hypothetical protein